METLLHIVPTSKNIESELDSLFARVAERLLKEFTLLIVNRG